MNNEEWQKILEIGHDLQTNHSNAASTPKWKMVRFLGGKVYERYNREKGRYEYSLQPFEEVTHEQALKSPRIVSNGRKAIPEETIAKIKQMRLEGHTVRSIAEQLRVGRGTVEKYMKF